MVVPLAQPIQYRGGGGGVVAAPAMAVLLHRLHLAGDERERSVADLADDRMNASARKIGHVPGPQLADSSKFDPSIMKSSSSPTCLCRGSFAPRSKRAITARRFVMGSLQNALCRVPGTGPSVQGMSLSTIVCEGRPAPIPLAGSTPPVIIAKTVAPFLLITLWTHPLGR